MLCPWRAVEEKGLGTGISRFAAALGGMGCASVFASERFSMSGFDAEIRLDVLSTFESVLDASSSRSTHWHQHVSC